MKRHITLAALTLATTLAATLAAAQGAPTGLWKTIDDETQQEKSFVRISEAGGVLSGKVERIVDPSKQDSKCDKCTDDRKDKPVLGMAILRDLKKGDDGHWEGGSIVDPNNGKVYRARVRVLEGGKQLEMRGYIGPFFRNQIWLKAE